MLFNKKGLIIKKKGGDNHGGLQDVGHASVTAGSGVFMMCSLPRLEFLKEVLRGITRSFSAHLFQKTFLDKKKASAHAVSLQCRYFRECHNPSY